jgi:hypothetical protein
MKPPAVQLMRNLGLEPDPWQMEVLESQQPRLLLNCCRQAGKSTVVALLGLAEALWVAGTQILIVSRSYRQSIELFRIISNFFVRLGEPMCQVHNKGELALSNGSRIVCLPCKEETIRGYSGIDLLILDEASRVPDDIYRTLRPMLAVSAGRMICLSTPRGKRGFFFDAWLKGGDDWQRIEIPASKVPRIKAEFLEEERRGMGESWFRQEYCCAFEALEGLVYPDFPRCVVPGPAPTSFKKRWGGLDFGFRNPFAAVWGGVDNDDVLWLIGEHYERQRPLSYHAARLPRDVLWVADPSGAGERAELTLGGLKVLPGNNAIRAGIAAVQNRIVNRTLRIVDGACPNLLAEAGLYSYGEGPQEHWDEQPIGAYDHALDALRYLIYRLDQRRMGRPSAPDAPLPPGPNPPQPEKKQPPEWWLRLNDPSIWTRIC